MTLFERLALAALAAALTRCEEAPAPPIHFTCARPDEAPLPDGFGGRRCLRVGAREGVRAELWPVTDGLPSPVVFVRAGAPAGGDGTRDRPLARDDRPAGVAAALRGMAERPDFSGQLTKIDVPTLVICGEEDAIAPPAEMQGIAAAIPGAKFVGIADAGHMAPLENPTEVNAAIRSFLQSR